MDIGWDEPAFASCPPSSLIRTSWNPQSPPYLSEILGLKLC